MFNRLIRFRLPLFCLVAFVAVYNLYQISCPLAGKQEIAEKYLTGTFSITSGSAGYGNQLFELMSILGIAKQIGR